MFDTIGPLPWDKQPGETNRAYTKWLVFRDLGPGRSLPKLHRKLAESGQGVSLTALKKLSAKWHWFERAHAWRTHLDETRAGHLASERAAASREHLEVARHQREIASVLLQQGTPEATLAAVRLADSAFKIARTELGLPLRVSRSEAEMRAAVARYRDALNALVGLVNECMCEQCREDVARSLDRVLQMQNEGEQAFL